VNNNIPKLAAQIKANPEDSFSKFALALELIKIDQPNKALTLFQNIRQHSPNYIGVYYHLAKLYIELGENNLAIETYKEGIEIAVAISDLHAKSELQGALMNLQLDIED
tara:strand:+ start:4447 stop:4773 length:327 start_codon:yes stop_codon:yes gene_type:complete